MEIDDSLYRLFFTTQYLFEYLLNECFFYFCFFKDEILVTMRMIIIIVIIVTIVNY